MAEEKNVIVRHNTWKNLAKLFLPNLLIVVTIVGLSLTVSNIDLSGEHTLTLREDLLIAMFPLMMLVWGIVTVIQLKCSLEVKDERDQLEHDLADAKKEQKRLLGWGKHYQEEVGQRNQTIGRLLGRIDNLITFLFRPQSDPRFESLNLDEESTRKLNAVLRDQRRQTIEFLIQLGIEERISVSNMQSSTTLFRDEGHDMIEDVVQRAHEQGELTTRSASPRNDFCRHLISTYVIKPQT